MPLHAEDRSLLEALLRLKTTHEPEYKAEHDRCRELIAQEAKRRGLRSLVVDSPPHPSMLVGYEPANKSPRVLLMAHLDVVPAAAGQFEPRQEGDRLYARGISDMKFAAPLYLRLLQELPPALKPHVLAAFTFDEEIGGSIGTRFLLDDYDLRAGACFLPDGGDNFQIEADEKGVLQFRVKTAGKAAHGSRPWLGENALDKFLEIHQDLKRAYPFVSQAGSWGPTFNLGKITGGAAANQVPDACEALLDIRFTETTTLKDVLARVTAVVGRRGEVSPIVQGDLFHLDPGSKAYRWLQEAARAHLGRELPIYRSEGASDARYFTKHGIDVVITKPTCAGHHSTSEWMDLPSLDPYLKMLRTFTETAAAA
jgi:succinyl-diaminopimelate desuccinylase